MSRSGCTDDFGSDNQWDLIRWRGAVKSSIRGNRGQAFLRELIDALDALPRPELMAGSFQESGGRVCALGSVGLARGVDLSVFDPEDVYVREHAAEVFGIAPALAAEVMWMNDDAAWRATDSDRWKIVRDWAKKNLTEPA